MVTYTNFPLLWVLKLQTCISLSTLHYECVSLSHSVRYLLPLESLIKEVVDNLVINIENMEFVSSSTDYEENNSTIIVVTSQRMNST